MFCRYVNISRVVEIAVGDKVGKGSIEVPPAVLCNVEWLVSDEDHAYSILLTSFFFPKMISLQPSSFLS